MGLTDAIGAGFAFPAFVSGIACMASYLDPNVKRSWNYGYATMLLGGIAAFFFVL